MSDAPVIVTGITTGIQPQSPVSALPQRLEWQQFVQNPQYLTLYVNALTQFMGLDQSEVTSYFQIGGMSIIIAWLIRKASMACHIHPGTVLKATIPPRDIATTEA
jgi:hypothetical protein